MIVDDFRQLLDELNDEIRVNVHDHFVVVKCCLENRDANLLSPSEIRQMIVDDFRQLLDELNDEIRVNVPRKKKKIDKSVSMTNKVSDNPLDGQRSKSLARITADREAAQAERTELRLLSASKMVQRSGVDVRKRSGQIGDIVSIIMDKKKEAQRRGLLGIAFAVSDNGGCCIITKHGIIGHGKGYLWVPIDRYKCCVTTCRLRRSCTCCVINFSKMSSLKHRKNRFLLRLRSS
jgi:hypothetical protein